MVPVSDADARPSDDLNGFDDDLSEESAEAAPPVVAVVVTHDPGPWFEECLASLAAQDYPALSVLVIDAASAEDPTARVARTLPSAYVRRLHDNRGYGATANEVLEVVEGAAFFLHCHDDVALAPDALRVMVQEAFRSNAGIVGPKLVAWDDTRRLLQVGMAADKIGSPSSMVEPGELDQEQHDAVRDVFYVPGGCTLVRSDLFRALGGFDPGIDLLGEDLDLCWRAQVAGARVLVAPAAVARHLEAYGSRRDVADRRLLQTRHRLRSMFVCYSPIHLLRVVPQAAFLSLVEVLYSLIAGRTRQAGDIASAWRWNLAHRGEIGARRRQLKGLRQMPDSEVRRLQVGGSARISAYVRGQIGQDDDRLRSVTAAGRDLAGSLRTGSQRTGLIGWAAVVLVLLFGSRMIITSGLVPFGDFPAFTDRPWTMFGHWLSNWRSAGLGSEAPAPTGYAVLGAAGTVLLGSMAVLRRLLIVAPLAMGAWGAWRLGRATGSTLGKVITLAAFMAIPLPYNAIARGRWGGLVVWAAAPWLLRCLANVSAAEPFGHVGGVRPLKRVALGLGLALAAVAAFVPFVLVVLMVMAAGLFLGGLVAGRSTGGVRVVQATVAAVAVAVVLLIPWTFDLLPPFSQWSSIAGVRSTQPLDFGAVLRFQTGPLGAGPIGWLFLPAAALPLLIGREWRLAWAARLWVVAVLSAGLMWAGQQSWFEHGIGAPEALLAPAAAALALSAGLGLSAFEIDLPGYRFGWRQVASLGAACSLALGVLPVLGASFDGRWDAPNRGFDSVLGFLDDEQAAVGPFRTLWIGDPDVLPLAGWGLRDGLAYASTDDGLPTVLNRWAGSVSGATRLLTDSVGLAEARLTNRLGRLLGLMGVRYIVLVEAASPGSDDVRPAPAPLLGALAEQLDLEELVSPDASVRMYRNAAWVPTRAQLGGDIAQVATADGDDFFAIAATTAFGDVAPALTEQDSYTSASGDVPADVTVYHAAASSPNWSLSVGGENTPRSEAFGWANAYRVEDGGRGSLSYSTPVVHYLLLVIQVGLWAAAVVLLLRWRQGSDA